VEGRRLCERVNALGRWKRRIEEARHASKRLRNLKLGNLLEWFGAFEQAAAARPKQCTGHCLTGSSFRMAWLRDFEASQPRASRPAARGTDCTTPLRNHGISASLQGSQGYSKPPPSSFSAIRCDCANLSRKRGSSVWGNTVQAIPHGADRAPCSPLRLRVICCPRKAEARSSYVLLNLGIVDMVL
jgi:hypothetical protein